MTPLVTLLMTLLMAVQGNLISDDDEGDDSFLGGDGADTALGGLGDALGGLDDALGGLGDTLGGTGSDSLAGGLGDDGEWGMGNEDGLK